jgi:phosphoribosylformimino-5-aminoimidazole carboxamide ribotide isomerase
MEIIPAIDIIDGQCIRLKKGDFSEKTIYYDDPVEVATMFHNQGFERLHLVDLDGAKAGNVVNYSVLEKIFNKTGLVIDFGGGIRTDADVEMAFQSGAAMITAGSIAVKDPTSVIRWIKKYSPEKIILGADVNKGKISVNAWKTETVNEIFGFIDGYRNMGIQKVICTDISMDGMMQGPAYELYKQLRLQFKDIYLIASGGIASLSDIDGLIEIGIDGVIIGRAIYEQTIVFKDLQKFIK